mgnify:FL=1
MNKSIYKNSKGETWYLKARYKFEPEGWVHGLSPNVNLPKEKVVVKDDATYHRLKIVDKDDSEGLIIVNPNDGTKNKYLGDEGKRSWQIGISLYFERKSCINNYILPNYLTVIHDFSDSGEPLHGAAQREHGLRIVRNEDLKTTLKEIDTKKEEQKKFDQIIKKFDDGKISNKEKFIEAIVSLKNFTNDILIELTSKKWSVWESEIWNGEIENEYFIFKSTIGYKWSGLSLICSGEPSEDGLLINTNSITIKKLTDLFNNYNLEDLDSEILYNSGFDINLDWSEDGGREILAKSIKFKNKIDLKKQENLINKILSYGDENYDYVDEDSYIWDDCDQEEASVQFENNSIGGIKINLNSLDGMLEYKIY